MARIRPRTDVRAGPASTTGAGFMERKGSGVLVPASVAIAGTGKRIITGSGALTCGPSIVAGDDAGVAAISGAWNVDPDNLSGSAGGNGILVGETGRVGGSASGLAGTGPFNYAQWQAKLASGSLIPGDVMYHWTADYAPSSLMEVRTNTSAQLALTTLTGPDPNRLWLVARPSHQPRIDYRGQSPTDNAIYASNGGNGPIHHDDAGNVRWEDWRVFSNAVIWGMTNATGAHSIDWFNIRTDHTGLPLAGGDNIGVIMVDGMKGCRIRGYQVVPGGHQTGTNNNTAEIYYITTEDLIIEYFQIRRDGIGYPIHHKRNATNVTMRYGILFNADNARRVYDGEATAQHYWEHMLFVTGNQGGGIDLIQDSNLHEPCGYLCELHHTHALSLGSTGPWNGLYGQTRSPPEQGLDTQLTYNLFDGQYRLGYTYGDASPTFVHRATSNFNQIRATQTGSLPKIRMFADYASLAAFRGATPNSFFVSGSNPTGDHDADSIEVDPTYGALDANSWQNPENFRPTNQQSILGTLVGPEYENVGVVGAGYTVGA